MIIGWFETPSGRRWVAVITGALCAGYAFWGVASMRSFALARCNIVIPAWWYLVASVPVLALLVGVLLPSQHNGWRRGTLSMILSLLSIISAMIGPLLYILYNIESILEGRAPEPAAP